MDLLCFGESLYDIFPDKERIGGAPLNVALTSSLLGLDTKIITAIGNDTRGDRLLLFLKKHNLGDFVQTNSHPTGTVKVTMDGTNHHFVIQDNTAYDFIAPFIDKKAKILYLGTLAQRHRASRQTAHQLLQQHQTVFFDPNLRPNTPWQKSFEQTMPHVTILKISDNEEKVIANTLDTNNLPSLLFSTYPLEQLIITKAEQGATLYLRDGTHLTTPGIKTQVKDTVGAGDAFCAAYIYSYLDNKSPKDCLDFANTLAAKITEIAGAQPNSITIKPNIDIQ